ncbi:MAG: type IV pilus modification PilV family protein [Gaiellaceae bacterium]
MSRLGLKDESGFSLVFTLLTILVTSITLTAVVQYTTSNSRSSERSKDDQISYALAEAGLANGAAVLSKPSNDALDPSVLPSSEPDPANPDHANYISEYEGGTVKWWGVLTGHQWLMHGVGYVEDPTGKTAPVRREVTSTIRIMPSLAQELNSQAWNYMFAKNTANACDVTFENSVQVDTSLYIMGDLCFLNTAAVTKAADPDVTNLYVGEHVQFGGTGAVGSAANPINQAQIGLGCRIGTSGAWTSPCSATTRVNADEILTGALPGSGPTAEFDFWYANAKPGPTQFCSTSSNMSATAFESAGSTTRNASAATFNLTPNSSYTCEYWDNELSPPEKLGELSWNNTTKVLSIKGAVYIDGSAYVSNNTTNSYSGLGTLYLSGTFRIDGSAQLCGGVSGGNCDFANWDPNTDNLGIITDGQDAQGYGILIQNQSRLQSSLYATYAVLVENQTVFDGPMVAGTFKLENNVVTHEFPTIFTVPLGWPGNDNVYAEPQPPSNYSG